MLKITEYSKLLMGCQTVTSAGFKFFCLSPMSLVPSILSLEHLGGEALNYRIIRVEADNIFAL
jgi:hypothetical protein